MRVEKWAQERYTALILLHADKCLNMLSLFSTLIVFCSDEMFKRSLGNLKTDIVKANALCQEANFLAEEMGRQTKFSVTLQIPPANLSPNRRVGALILLQLPALLVVQV